MLSVYVNREYLVLNLYTEIVVCEQKNRVIVIDVTVQDKKRKRIFRGLQYNFVRNEAERWFSRLCFLTLLMSPQILDGTVV